jgi:hypothetical protein
VFPGVAPFDPSVEKLLSDSGHQLISRARVILSRGVEYEDVCFTLQHKSYLEHSIQVMDRLLKGGVSPRRSVGPAARCQPAEAVVENNRAQIALLPQLPVDWQPDDPRQKAFLQRLPRRR